MKEWKNRTVDIFGTKYLIEFIPKTIEVDEERKAFGITNSENHKVQIALANSDGKRFNDEEIYLTLLHELTHVIMTEGCYMASNDDEPLVEWIAKCLRSFTKQKIWNI